MPALLRHARHTYGAAMRDALTKAGFNDIPRNGLYLIGGLALAAGDTPLAQLIKELRTSKQAAGVLVDTLVTRGYLERTVDKDDRRKMNVALTERGRATAAVQAMARTKVDNQLVASVGVAAWPAHVNELSTKKVRFVLGHWQKQGSSTALTLCNKRSGFSRAVRGSIVKVLLRPDGLWDLHCTLDQPLNSNDWAALVQP